MRTAVLAFALTLAGCAAQLDQDAALSDQYLAASEALEPVRLELERARGELQALGYDLEVRTDGENRGTTLWSTILLPSNWAEKSETTQLLILRHEAVHARQWHDLGAVTFGAQYAVERSRWILEMHGYRQEVRDRCTLEHTRESIEERINDIAAEFPQGYGFTRSTHKAIERETRNILLAELEFCQGL